MMLKVHKEFWKELQKQSEVQELFVTVSDGSLKILIKRKLSSDDDFLQVPAGGKDCW